VDQLYTMKTAKFYAPRILIRLRYACLKELDSQSDSMSVSQYNFFLNKTIS